MNWIILLCFFVYLPTIHNEEIAPENNEVIPTKVSMPDENLGRTLTSVESKDVETKDVIEDNNVEPTTSREEILEESTVRDKMSVHFYSANVDSAANPNTENDILKYFLGKVKTPHNTTENIIIKFSSSNVGKEIDSEMESTNESKNVAVTNTNKNLDIPNTPLEEAAFAPNPNTTTSKPAPTHNEDGENIEVVEKQDIKIFEAPLVSAFTVHQDNTGVPKKVIPLLPPIVPTPIPVIALSSISIPGRTAVIQSTEIVSPSNDLGSVGLSSAPSSTQSSPFQLPVPSFLRPEALVRHQEEQRSVFSTQSTSPVLQQSLIPPDPITPSLNSFNHQASQSYLTNFSPVSQTLSSPQLPQNYNINHLLLERQKLLEEQIYFLQNQARQQQQQILIQQQLLTEKRKKRFENLSVYQTQLIPSQDISNDVNSNTPRIIPSVTQRPRYEISNEQELPFRDSINFRSNPIPIIQSRSPVQIEPSNHISYIQQQNFIPVPLEFSAFQQLPQKSFQQFKSPILQDQNSQRTRIFRHESETGNFGLSRLPTERYFQPSLSRQVPDNQLQTLFFQSALNHGISSNTPQHLHYPWSFGSF